MSGVAYAGPETGLKVARRSASITAGATGTRDRVPPARRSLCLRNEAP
jgi:hypothetical protein